MPAVTQAVYVIVSNTSFPFERRGDRVIAGPLTLRRDVRKDEAIPTCGWSSYCHPLYLCTMSYHSGHDHNRCLDCVYPPRYIHCYHSAHLPSSRSLSTTATLDTLNPPSPSGSLLSGPATGNEHPGFIFDFDPRPN